MTAEQKDDFIKQFREYMDKPDARWEISRFRPAVDVSDRVNDGWQHFEPGKTTYALVVIGPRTKLEDLLLGMMQRGTDSHEASPDCDCS